MRYPTGNIQYAILGCSIRLMYEFKSEMLLNYVIKCESNLTIPVLRWDTNYSWYILGDCSSRLSQVIFRQA